MRANLLISILNSRWLGACYPEGQGDPAMKLSLYSRDDRRPHDNARRTTAGAGARYARVWAPHPGPLVPANSPVRFYTHPLKPMDRIQVFNEVWSHAHFDGQSWLVTSRPRGHDPASLDAYLTRLR